MATKYESPKLLQNNINIETLALEYDLCFFMHPVSLTISLFQLALGKITTLCATIVQHRAGCGHNKYSIEAGVSLCHGYSWDYWTSECTVVVVTFP